MSYEMKIGNIKFENPDNALCNGLPVPDVDIYEVDTGQSVHLEFLGSNTGMKGEFKNLEELMAYFSSVGCEVTEVSMDYGEV